MGLNTGWSWKKTMSEVAKRLEIGAEADHQITVSEFGERFHLESLEA